MVDRRPDLAVEGDDESLPAAADDDDGEGVSLGANN